MFGVVQAWDTEQWRYPASHRRRRGGQSDCGAASSKSPSSRSVRMDVEEGSQSELQQLITRLPQDGADETLVVGSFGVRSFAAVSFSL